MPKVTSLSRTEKALADLALQMNLEFVDAELKKEAGELYLRITIDKEGGLSLQDCENYHRKCVPIVENVEYDYLECSSPGIDRPLKKERDFLKHIGKKIEVRLFSQRDGQKIFTGELLKYEGGAFEIMTAQGRQGFTLKEAALVKPVVDYEADFAKGE